MTWLTLRIMRGELLLLLAAAACLTAVFVATYDVARLLRRPFGVEDCPVPLTYYGGSEEYCQIDQGVLYPWVSSSVTTLVVLPLIVAILLAIPSVMELSSRTYRLAWTQSQTRWQWARARLAVLLVCGLAVTVGAIALVRWWPHQIYYFWGTENFDVLGIVNIGWFVLAAGLILAIGTLLRRPLIALALGAIGYGLTRIVWIEAIRPRLIPPKQVDVPASGFLDGNPWVLEAWSMRSDGMRLTDQEYGTLCPQMFLPGWTDAEFQAAYEVRQSCLDSNGIMTHYTYQPDSRFWPLQYVETGLVAAIGLALIGWTVWYWVRRLE